MNQDSTHTGLLFEAVQHFFFEELSQPIFLVEGLLALQITFVGEHGEWPCYAEVYEEQGRFIFYSIWPEEIPESKRLDIVEFITRVNYSLLVGNFELNLDSGELQFKTSIDVEGDRLSQALIRQAVQPNLLTMDLYWPGIEAIVSSYVSPQRALEIVFEQ